MTTARHGAARRTTVLVTGGRAFTGRELLYSVLDALQGRSPGMVVVQGGARGADRIAREWATLHNVPCITVSANWLLHGRAAGPLRNQRMLDEHAIDICVAMPGGNGTDDMVRRVQAKGGIELLDHRSAEREMNRYPPTACL